MKNVEFTDKFINRHIGPDNLQKNVMLDFIGLKSDNDLMINIIPENIQMKNELELENEISEFEFLSHLKQISQKNKVFKSFIGLGYYPSITPMVIQRNILENPGWYTQYTPYQAEISQGRLEALLNFQTMICDLTGLPLSNASLLDEGTAAAEAMIMSFTARKDKDKNTFFVSDEVFPQTIDVVCTRAEALGIEIVIGKHTELKDLQKIFGVLVQYPSSKGEIYDYTDFFKTNSEKGVYNVIAADLLSLALLTSPGELGADVAVGTTQRFGVPMAYGGPHAAYFAAKDEFRRQIPGRVIGMSVDKFNKPALRMALQTREQHIKRDKATSNICTSQVLLAIMASMYAVYHGPEGLRKTAQRIYNLTEILARSLRKLNYKIINDLFFDTLTIKIEDERIYSDIKTLSENNLLNFGYFYENCITVSISEVTTIQDIKIIAGIFAEFVSNTNMSAQDFSSKDRMPIPDKNLRKTEFLAHPVFNSYHSETEMMRYIKKLERKDLSLTHSMISLGSCTMKLNAASEMAGITWSEFANIHPFAPEDQVEGYRLLIKELENQLKIVTGFDAVSLQPNSGAQGEYAGLMVIRAYHHSRGDFNRNVVLIPSSAHGTNPASAVMAGGKVTVVGCDKDGNIDIEDLRKKAQENKENLAALMVTYPSTHGVFEEEIKQICEIIHSCGGQVYMDGANMNAQVGLTSPALIGADICHLNLHKTFAIPHGGGGPGVGPIAAAKHLASFLPGHPVIKTGGEKAIRALSSAPWGSAGILMIPYGYIKMTGAKGLKTATETAILNANYIKEKLKNTYPVLFVGKKGFVAHEMILDMREFKISAGIEVEDIAKRLMDYGYHAPTVSFPVPGTLMIEPTESESKAELDKFCDAMISIRNEIKEIEDGLFSREDNVLKNSPHTADEVISDNWQHSYSREKAAFPLSWVRENKFWPSVSRINNAYGDRNLVCTCPPVNSYKD